jgi:2',3'-cyclic-nucleotide 2'-phosphodiesterase/3'-nucleotidase
MGAAGSVLLTNGAHGQTAATRLHLRVLGTSDLHMFALDWDYYLNRPDPTVGLTKLASLIAKARSQARNCLLLDNGDILQGGPMGDFLATVDQFRTNPAHPFFLAMNALAYDAATLGNHEFNFGLPFLERALKSADFPFVCANVRDAANKTILPPYVILQRRLQDEDGASHDLRIGVIGFVPPQIMVWDRVHLEGKVSAQSIVASARQFLPELRNQCDLLIALCHSGIGDGRADPNAENVAEQVAALDEVDAIITGHSHRVFPGPDYAGRPGIDAQKGTLGGKPGVMPGFWGSHLGVIDLNLEKGDGRWRIAAFQSDVRPIYRREGTTIVPISEPDPQTSAIFAKAHAQVQDWVNQPIGELETPLHSYFVWAGRDLPTALINEAQLDYARSLLSGTPLAELPLLSAAAPVRAGYTPDAYVDIKAGPIAIRDAANLYMFSNTVSIVRVNGAVLKNWLEHAARVFQRVDPDNPAPQPLLDLHVPTYNFDVIAGLTYEIDLSQPVRTDINGKIIAEQAHRIVNLRYEGQPVDARREFLVVTNNYRAGGGGRFPSIDGNTTVLNDASANRDALISFIRKSQRVAVMEQSPWGFVKPKSSMRVWFDSAPNGIKFVSDIPNLRNAGEGRSGYNRFELLIG